MSNCLELLNVSFCPCLHVEWNTAIQPQNVPKANIQNLVAGKVRWQNRLKPVIHRMPKQQITIGKKYARLFSYLLGRGHCKWQETATGKTECRLRGFFIGREKDDWCYFRCAEKHAINTIKLAYVANSIYEPPELECTYSAKSRPAKQYRNKAIEVKANRDKVTQTGHSSSRHLSEGKVRSGGDLCSFKQRPTFLWQSIFFQSWIMSL